MATVRRMEERLPLGFGLTFLVLIINAILCVWTVHEQVQDSRRVDHTYRVRVILGDLRADLADAMAIERRYVILDDAKGMDRFDSVISDALGRVTQLRSMTADNSGQQAHLDRIERQAGTLINGLRQEIAIRRDRGVDPALAEIRSGRVASSMDDLRREITSMSDFEKSLLAERETRTRHAIERTIVTLAAATALAVGLLGLVYLLTQHYIQVRDAAEHASRQSEERFRTLAEAVPQIVWITRPDGFHEYYNQRWYDYTGMSAKESIGWGWSLPLHPDDKVRSEARWNKATSTGEPYEIEYRFRAGDGSYRWFLGRALPVRDELGRVLRWFGTCTDIEGQKRTEAELARAKEVAESAGRAKDQFLAMLSHEFRTPLNPVLLAATAAMQDPATSPEQLATFDMIRHNIELEARLIDDLLDVMRVIRGKMRYQWSVVDLHLLINRTFDICRSDWLGSRIDLRSHLLADRHHVQADPARLQQVLWNLVKNAVKFTPEGRTIEVETRNDGGGHVIVAVKDTGMGIVAADLDRIFNAFEQGEDPRTHKFGGLGLGLAISRSIAEAHGGSLVAESPGPDQGSTFTLTLRASEPQADATLVASSAPAVAGRQRLNLLLVEDDAMTARIMSKLLRGVGHSVQTAGSIADAIAAASPELDLVVSDLGLPDGSGLDLMREIRERYGLAGIALTGFGMDDDIEKSRAAGFLAHLTKPVDFPRLEETIQRIAAETGRE